MQFRFGASVDVWPAHARVPLPPPAFGVFLPMTGKTVVWDRHWQARANDGDLHFHNPAATPAPEVE